MSYLTCTARIVVLAGACALGGCGSGSKVPTPVVPAEGQFVWTVDGVTVTANDTFMVEGLKSVGYRFGDTPNYPLLSIEGTTEQMWFCTLMTRASTLPAPGSYPVGDTADGNGTFGVLCNDPTSTIPDNNVNVADGEVVITKAEPGDLEGTFRVWSRTDTAVGGFNVGCIYDDCLSPP